MDLNWWSSHLSQHIPLSLAGIWLCHKISNWCDDKFQLHRWGSPAWGVKWCNWNKMKQSRRKRGKTRRQVVCSTLQLSELTVLHCWMSKRTEVAWSYIHHQRHKWILRIADSFPVHMLCNFLWKHFCRQAIFTNGNLLILCSSRVAQIPLPFC